MYNFLYNIYYRVENMLFKPKYLKGEITKPKVKIMYMYPLTMLCFSYQHVTWGSLGLFTYSTYAKCEKYLCQSKYNPSNSI